MAYIGKSPTGSGVRQRYVYTATGGETSLSGADDNSKTLKFTDGEYVDVHLNGIQLVQGTDYGVGTTNTINGLAALAANDVVEITVFDVYNVAKINSEAMRNRWYYTATGGETSITTTEISGLSFPANAEIEVRLNGIALVQGTDYNTTTANTVGGLAALSSGNVVEIVYYEAFQLADVVSKAAGGTYNGDVTFNGNINAGTIKDATGTNTGITIDSSGRVLLPQVPCCHVRLTTSNSQDTSNPYTTLATNIKFDSIELNQGSCYSASTGAFTCPVAGVYAADVHLLSNNGATIDHEIKLLHNSTTVHFGYNGVDSQFVPIRAHGLIDCAVNDTISVQLTQGQIYINASGVYSLFTVRLVG
jgi:hypothetical protein